MGKLPCAIVLLAGTASAQDMKLWYDKPAAKWSAEALPLGNGRLGCMLFGGVARERIQFNEDSLWTGDENPSGDYKTMGAYQSFGDLTIDLGAEAKPAGEEGYLRALSLADAEHRVTFRKDGVTHTRTAFASHPDNVIVLRCTADRAGSVSGTVKLQGAHGETTKAEGNELSFAGSLKNGLEYEARARVLAKGGKVQARDGALHLSGCDEVMILLAAGTNYIPDYGKKYRGPNPGERLRQQLDAAAKLGYDELRARHVADHQKLFGRVDATWGETTQAVRALPTDRRLAAYRAAGADPELEALLFQMGRYLLIACSRRPGMPANLQGLWNDSNSPPWSSDYHANINVQMNYWLAEPSGLAECHLPFFDLIQSQLEPWRKATQADKEFKTASGTTRGWALRTSHNITGGLGWKWDKTANAWYCQHLWEHYAFGGDKEYLKAVAYPIMKEICEFWEERLKALPDGTLVVPRAWSPEHGPDEDGVSYSQEIVWDLFNNYVEAADALGADKAYRDKVAAMRDKLVTPKIGKWGQLQEWMVDRDDPKDQHRHTSHLFAVYPGRQISMAKTPDPSPSLRAGLAKAAAVSLAARGEAGDSRRSWTWPWRCAMWARLGEAENAGRMVRGLLAYNTLPNLFANHPPFQMDGNFGITAGICEMLVQSQAGEIVLLPALPKAWHAGKARGLRARGGFEVDVEWQDGKLVAATLRSRHGQPCKVRCGDKAADLKIPAGGAATISGDLVPK